MNSVTDVMLAQIKEVDERDDHQILTELAGATIREYIYEIYDKKDKTKRLAVKLSWVGTKEMARDRGNIHIEEVPGMVENGEGYVRVVVRATDLKRNFSVFGGCHQPVKMRINITDKAGNVVGHELVDDPFCFQKALTKAQRNAFQNVMPASYMAKWIDKMLQLAGKQPVGQLPQARPKAATPSGLVSAAKKATEVKPEQVKSLFELEKVVWDVWKIQPADMYRMLATLGMGDGTKASVSEAPYNCFLAIKGEMDARGGEPCPDGGG